jgi:hypothetical protein
MVAEQLFNLTPVPARIGNASVRAPLEQWELRVLRAEPDFAPVDELGGRLFSFADKPALAPSAQGRASDVIDAIQSVLSSHQPGMPPAGTKSDLVAGTGLAQEPPRRSADEVKSAAAVNLDMPTTVRDNPLIANFAAPRWDGEHIGRFLVVLVFTLLLTFMLLTVIHTAIMRRKSMFGPGPATGGEGPSTAPEAQACHELMKQIASELMKATGAVNSLQDVPVLQSTLYRELNSIRQSLGFAPPTQSNSAARKDWYAIKSQLSTGLQGTRRIVEVAQAARVSFSFPQAARQEVTTPVEAYAFLGVNATSGEALLKRTVNALRLCWHPDFATDEEDRRLREMRTKQINVAWDLISQKRMSA